MEDKKILKTTNIIAKILKKEGIKFVTGFPMNYLHEALAEEGIRFVKFRTERVAVNAADGFSRATFGEHIGVVSIQFGPGTENAFGGIAVAFSDSTPILIIPGSSPVRRKGILPDFDIIKNLGGVTKWANEITHAEYSSEMMRRAFNNLRNGRPGPAMIVLPEDVALEEVDDKNLNYDPVKRSKPSGDPADIREALKAIIKAKNPIIRAGSGILYAKAWDKLLEFAELLQIPVFTTINGKSAFPEDHPLSLGCGGRTRPDMVTSFLEETDLIFAIGSSCTKEPYTTHLPPDKVIIQSTIDERDINKDYNVAHVIIGDAQLVLSQLIDETKKQFGIERIKRNDSVVKKIKAIKEEWMNKWMPKLTSEEIPINPYRVIGDIMKALPEKETIITHDSGHPRDQMIPFYRSNTPGGYLGWGKSTALGQGLGLALGAKMAHPDKTVVNVMGDAAFGMVGMDFETGVRERIPIITIILNNSRLGGYGKRFPMASKLYGLNIVSGDYTKIAEGLGAGYVEKVINPNDIIPAIKRAKESLSTGKPSLLEIITREDDTFSGERTATS